MKRFSLFVLCCLALVFAAGCSGGKSETKQSVNYPTKPIQVILPYTTGGDTDVAARVIGKYLSNELKKPVVVTNMPGSSGAVAINKVASSDPDGHTVLFHHTAMLIGSMLGLTDKSYNDFTPGGIAMGSLSQVWVVKSSSGFKSIQDVVSKAKAQPESVKFATLFGNFTHLEALAFEKSAGVKLKKVDAGAASEHLAALLGGHVDMISIQYNLIADYVEKGDLIPLAVLCAETNPLIPKVKTMKQQGIDMNFEKMYYYMFPKNTPKEVVDVFAAALKKVADNPQYQAEAKKMYMSPLYKSPAETQTILKVTSDYIHTFKDLVKK